MSDRSLPGIHEPAPEPEKSGKRFLRIMTPVALVMVMLSVFVSCVTRINQNSSDDNGNNRYEVIAQCEARIEELLKAPATADFNSTATGSGTWSVTGTVDAENSFGATVRAAYSCTVVVNGDGTLSTSVDSFDG